MLTSRERMLVSQLILLWYLGILLSSRHNTSVLPGDRPFIQLCKVSRSWGDDCSYITLQFED